MIVVQESWDAAGPPGSLSPMLAAAKTRDEVEAPLILLPLADEPRGMAPAEGDVATLLSAAASSNGVFLAAAARVTAEDGVVRSRAWLFGPDGQALLAVDKILPDLVDGFSDSAAGLGRPHPFPVARTPHGQIAILIGEDVLQNHHVRAAMLNGAEVILNPAREVTDHRFDIRQQARMARAYENHCLIVCACPARLTRHGFTEALPTASAVYNEWAVAVRAKAEESFLAVPLDVEAVRRRRAEWFGNLCIITRPSVYAPGYRAAAGQVQAGPDTSAGWGKEAVRRADARAVPLPQEPRWDIVLGQVTPRTITDPERAEEVIDRNLDHAFELTGRFAKSPTVRMVAFPEFFLQGSSIGRDPEILNRCAIPMRGHAMDRIGKFAQDHKTYFTGSVLERDPDWPGYTFNCAFIVNDSGDVIHVYRKVQCADVFGHFHVTTPGSILDRYTQKYGYEGLFPVADTPLGRIATAVCFDMNFPELHRAFAQRGADVLIHPTSEPHNIRRRAWENSRQVRAYENCMYVVSAAQGGEYWEPDDTVPTAFNRGHAKVVNFDGSVQSVADGPGAVPLQGQIDLRALYDARRDVRHNLPLWDAPMVYADTYAAHVSIPDNLKEAPTHNPYAGGKALKEVIARWTAEGVFIAPGNDQSHRTGEAMASGGY